MTENKNAYQKWLFLRPIQRRLSPISNFWLLNRGNTTIKISFLKENFYHLKGVLAGLRQFWATESPLKMMKKALYFISECLFVLKIFKFLSWHFGHAAKRFDQKDKVKVKFYDVTAWSTNNFNTHIAQYLKKAMRQWNLVSW